MPPTIQDHIRMELAKILAPALATGRKDIDISQQGQYNTGPGGNFNLPGVNREFISTVIEPKGLLNALPAVGSMFANPQFGYITGFGALTGSRASDVCDDARIPGGIVTCLQTAMFGRYRLDTKPIEINRVGLLNNAADPLDFTLMNPTTYGNILPGGYDMNMLFNPRMEMQSRMNDVAREMAQILAQQVWYGDPSDVTWNTGGEYSMPGMDTLIGTTKIDARSGTPCTALASDIKNFNYWNITRNGGLDLFNALYYIVQTRKFVASRTNMGNVQWAFAMREAAFNEIVKIWPCVMATFGCVPGGNGTVTPTITVDNQLRTQEAMLENPYLPLGGRNIPVIIDDAIIEEDLGSGALASDIYYLAMTVKGGRPVKYREYLDYERGAMLAANQSGQGRRFRTDNGQFLWWDKPNTNVCIQMGVKTEQRVINLTPHLDGKLLSVAYTPLQHSPDSYSGQLYHTVTGESVRPEDPALYSDWNTSGPGTR